MQTTLDMGWASVEEFVEDTNFAQVPILLGVVAVAPSGGDVRLDVQRRVMVEESVGQCFRTGVGCVEAMGGAVDGVSKPDASIRNRERQKIAEFRRDGAPKQCGDEFLRNDGFHGFKRVGDVGRDALKILPLALDGAD